MQNPKSRTGEAAEKPGRQHTDDEKKIIEEITKQHKNAREFLFNRVGNKFEDGNMYMVTFIEKGSSRDMSWYYAYLDKGECQLFEEGDDAIVYMQNMLEKRRSILQRLRDFDFLDIVGALIALPIAGAFVYLVVSNQDSQDVISKEFLTIVSLILGYYFGRNKVK